MLLALMRKGSRIATKVQAPISCWAVIAPALEPPAPLPPPKCPACGKVMVLMGSVARKPP
jgi:hypothetical protein